MSRPTAFASLLVALMALLFTAACSAGPPREPDADAPPPTAATDDDGPARDAGAAPSSPRPSHHDALVPARLVAALRSGGVALVDPFTGGVLAASPPLAAPARDVAFDPWGARLVTAAVDDDAGGTVVEAVPLERAGLGAPRLLARLDADARVAATSSGVVVFEAGYGARWRLLARDGAPRPTLAAPAPMSLSVEEGPSLAVVRALVAPEGGGLAFAFAEVGPGGFDAPGGVGSAPLDVAGLVGEAPRWVDGLPRGRGVVVDAIRGEVRFRHVDRRGVGPAVAIPGLPLSVGARVQHALAVSEGRRLVLLLAKPSRVVVVDLDEPFAPRAARFVDLPGHVRPESRFFSRELTVIGDRAFAATSEGVFAIELRRSGALALDPGFPGRGLAGPLCRETPDGDVPNAAW